jgi:hypothetical protein
MLVGRAAKPTTPRAESALNGLVTSSTFRKNATFRTGLTLANVNFECQLSDGALKSYGAFKSRVIIDW